MYKLLCIPTRKILSGERDRGEMSGSPGPQQGRTGAGRSRWPERCTRRKVRSADEASASEDRTTK